MGGKIPEQHAAVTMIHQYQQHVACQRLCSIICHQLDRQLVASIQHLHLAITQTASSVNHIKKKKLI